MSPLSKGTAWHLVHEAHYREIKRHQDRAQELGEQVDERTVERACRDAVDRTISEQILTTSSELADLINWMYQGHLAKWGLDPQWRVLAVEHAAQCRLPTSTGRPSGFVLKMKIDLIVAEATTPKPRIMIVDAKCLDDQTRVTTRELGQMRVGHLTSGDLVLGSDGNWHRVSHVSHLVRECYRIRLRNGTEVTCSGDHRWPVERRTRAGTYRREELTTEELIRGRDSGEQYRMFPAPATRHPDRPFAIDPYLLGALLGDGGFTRNQISFTKGHKPTVDRVIASLPENSSVTRVGEHPSKAPTYYFTGSVGHEIKFLGLSGKRGHEKFIPRCYMLGSFSQRLELLRGLMDTDGTFTKGVPVYQTGSKQLAEDVRDLAVSLGGVAGVRTIEEPKHQRGTGASSYQVKMRFPRDFPIPCHHEEKAKKYVPSHWTLGERLVIEDISPVGPRNCTDITVSADDSLFVAEGILTHNSCRNLPKGKDFDFDDQFGLYTWGLRKMGKRVFGQIHSAARTERLVKEEKAWRGEPIPGDTDQLEGLSYLPGKVQPLDQRFVRTRMYRTDVELDRIAVETWQVMKARYDQQKLATRSDVDSPRHTDPDRCSWRCDYTEPCLAGRKGVDLREYLHGRGFQQDFTRN